MRLSTAAADRMTTHTSLRVFVEISRGVANVFFALARPNSGRENHIWEQGEFIRGKYASSAERKIAADSLVLSTPMHCRREAGYMGKTQRSAVSSGVHKSDRALNKKKKRKNARDLRSSPKVVEAGRGGPSLDNWIQQVLTPPWKGWSATCRAGPDGWNP